MPPAAGAHNRGGNLANMASAISALYGLGYTLAEDDHLEGMEEDHASDKSSPHILHHRHMYGGFENVHHNGHHHYNMGPTAGHGHPTPPMSSYAAMLAGIGLNLTAVSFLPPLCRSNGLFRSAKASSPQVPAGLPPSQPYSTLRCSIFGLLPQPALLHFSCTSLQACIK